MGAGVPATAWILSQSPEVEKVTEVIQGESTAETIEVGETLLVYGTLLGVDGQSVRLKVTEGKYHMVRRILANCGHPVVALHRDRYGEVRLDELDISEGEAAPIDGEALEWALGLGLRAGDV